MSRITDLSGEWSFLLGEGSEKAAFTDTFTVPGTVSYNKKGTPGTDRPDTCLYDPYITEGCAWFRRSLPVRAKEAASCLFRIERTRVSRVWVDGEYAGSRDSFVGAHEYELAPFIKRDNPVLTVMVSNTGYKTGGGHMTSPDTQTNWNGMLGEVSIKLTHSVRIAHLTAKPDFEARAAAVELEILNLTDAALSAEITAEYEAVILRDEYLETDREISVPGNISPAAASSEADVRKLTRPVSDSFSFTRKGINLEPGQNTVKIALPPGESPFYWSDEHPYIYPVNVTVTAPGGTDTAFTLFGYREFTTSGMSFMVNGNRKFLRGKHDGMVFPLTGFAPMNVYGWLKVMKTAKDFGINHYRFHTCCPPDAAFTAADLLGIYMQPEIPFWGTFHAPGDEGYNAEAQEFLKNEGFTMLKSFTSHPSFCLMSMGNELWGSSSAINEMMAGFRKAYPGICYTQGSNNFQWCPCVVENDSFFSGVRFTIDRQIRGSYASCDQPYGHVQRDVPGTRFNYESAIKPGYIGTNAPVGEDGYIEIQYGTGIKRVKATEAAGELRVNIPIVSHEIGQYVTYPPFTEIEKYTGVLKPRNLEIFRERLEKAGLADNAEAFFRNSGALAAACYRDEIETALRTESLSGFQLLDLQDFPGQGTALVGMLDAFMENKGIISAREWRRFCSDAVIQAEFDSYVLTNGEDFDFDISLSCFREDPLPACRLSCTLTRDGAETPLYSFETELSSIRHDGRSILSGGNRVTPRDNGVYTLQVRLEGIAENSYTLWVYPPVPAEYRDKGRLKAAFGYAETLEEARELLKKQPRALLILSDTENPDSVPGDYASDFWNFHMFRSISEGMKKPIPAGTLGLVNDTAHPALNGFPCKAYTTPQWFSIIMNSRPSVLDGTEARPVSRVIDNYERNHSLGLIYETPEGMLVCASDLPKLVSEGRPEALSLLESLSSWTME